MSNDKTINVDVTRKQNLNHLTFIFNSIESQILLMSKLTIFWTYGCKFIDFLITRRAKMEKSGRHGVATREKMRVRSFISFLG